MKAPEKIYCVATEGGYYLTTNKSESPFAEAVEYTRTDVFIEKACNAYCEVCGHYHHTVPYEICRHDCNYYSDFKEHLKGE